MSMSPLFQTLSSPLYSPNPYLDLEDEVFQPQVDSKETLHESLRLFYDHVREGRYDKVDVVFMILILRDFVIALDTHVGPLYLTQNTHR